LVLSFSSIIRYLIIADNILFFSIKKDDILYRAEPAHARVILPKTLLIQGFKHPDNFNMVC